MNNRLLKDESDLYLFDLMIESLREQPQRVDDLSFIMSDWFKIDQERADKLATWVEESSRIKSFRGVDNQFYICHKFYREKKEDEIEAYE